LKRTIPQSPESEFLSFHDTASIRCFSDRRIMVVIADEAYRSQCDFIDGFAKHIRDALPKASFISFAGTPIESGDKNTQTVFGDLASQAPPPVSFPALRFALSRAVSLTLRHPAIEVRQGSVPFPGAVNRALAVRRRA
jgi:hypothetical protein